MCLKISHACFCAGCSPLSSMVPEAGGSLVLFSVLQTDEDWEEDRT